MREINRIKKYLRSILFNPHYISLILRRNVDDNHQIKLGSYFNANTYLQAFGIKVYSLASCFSNILRVLLEISSLTESNHGAFLQQIPLSPSFLLASQHKHRDRLMEIVARQRQVIEIKHTEVHVRGRCQEVSLVVGPPLLNFSLSLKFPDYSFPQVRN